MKKLAKLTTFTAILLALSFNMSSGNVSAAGLEANTTDSSVLISGECGDNLTFTVTSDNTLTISGSGDMYNDSPWYGYTITQVKFSGNITSIGSYAFENCNSLTSVSSSTVTSIGEGAFRNCNKLTSVSLPSVASIDNEAFYGCEQLASVSLPNVTSIGESAFAYCDQLSSISLPTVTSIGNEAFSECDGLASVSLPSATSIGSKAFYNCGILKKVTVPQKFAANISIFGYTPYLSNNVVTSGTIGNCLYTINHGTLTISGNGTLSVSDGFSHGALDDIYHIAAYCSKVVIEKGVNISEYAFFDCDSIVSVSGTAATNISDNAFQSCDALTSVSLPAATGVSRKAFYNCDALASVSLPAAKNIGWYAFWDCDALSSVSLPAATSIDDCAFEDCDALSSVSLPAATDIGAYAFKDCGALSSVSLPAAPGIGNYAFKNCDSLRQITLRCDCNVPSYLKITPTIIHTFTSWKKISKPTALAPGKMQRICSGCDKIETKTFGQKLTPTIKLSAAKKTLQPKKSFTLKISKLAIGDAVKSVTTSKKSIATFKKLKTNQYKITAMKKGKAVITVTLKSGKKATCKITVK